MEFLKAILGADLYAQIEQAINAHNGNEANKENQVKLGNLASGEYVGKGKFSTLEAENQSNAAKLAEANNLIAELKKATNGQEDLQGKITAYEGQVAQLQAELEQTKLEAAIKVDLLSAKALDVDYLTFKLKEKGELSLDENGKVKGMDDKIAALKTQFPTQFETAAQKNILENRLPETGAGDNVVTKEEFNKMGYNSRVELKKNNPELYSQMMKG